MIHVKGLGARMALATQPLNAKPSQAPMGAAVLQDMEFAVYVSSSNETNKVSLNRYTQVDEEVSGKVGDIGNPRKFFKKMPKTQIGLLSLRFCPEINHGF
jgi:hypothetical protein